MKRKAPRLRCRLQIRNALRLRCRLQIRVNRDGSPSNCVELARRPGACLRRGGLRSKRHPIFLQQH
jgi:hypothetical protein